MVRWTWVQERCCETATYRGHDLKIRHTGNNLLDTGLCVGFIDGVYCASHKTFSRVANALLYTVDALKRRSIKK